MTFLALHKGSRWFDIDVGGAQRAQSADASLYAPFAAADKLLRRLVKRRIGLPSRFDGRRDGGND
jgi:hypothetical protein